MKLSDYIAHFFVQKGIHHVFFVSGGAAIHLIDSAARHPEIFCVPAQHEQNSIAAADMYSRVTGNLGLAISTSGPGATNMVTGVSNAYFDSIPLVVLTGQVARFRIKKNTTLRQRGFQETDVLSIFKSITKHSVLITDPTKIRYELEKAVHIAREGRPGPVVLDIPDDLQREQIKPDALEGFSPANTSPFYEKHVPTFLNMLHESTRPIVILGAGVHYAKAENEVQDFIRFYHLPCVLTWGGADLLPENDPLNMGRVGVCGPRGGNFAVQNADLVIALGTRLSQMITGGKQSLFAPHAKKIMIDIDPEELNKFGKETFELDLKIQAHLPDFVRSCCVGINEDHFEGWRKKIRAWCTRYPITFTSTNKRVNPYLFIQELSKVAKEGDIIIGDTGANLSWLCQKFAFKKSQRIFSAWNHTPMGYALPASVGAAFATDQTILCLTGDGGLMMCLQELATIRRFNLAVRVFIFDNQGHGIQKQTLDTWLGSRYVAVDVASGLYFPDYNKIAEAFQLPFFSIKTDSELDKLSTIYEHPGPYICNIAINESQKIIPMLKFGSGLEDLNPRLPQEEIKNIVQEALEEPLMTNVEKK